MEERDTDAALDGESCEDESAWLFEPRFDTLERSAAKAQSM